MGSQKRDHTRGKEEEGNGKNTGAVPQSDGEPPGRLAAPCFGLSAPSPVGCTGRQMVSFLQTLVSSVTKPLWNEGGGGGKQRKPSGKYTKELCCSKTYRKDFPIDKLLSAFPV